MSDPVALGLQGTVCKSLDGSGNAAEALVKPRLGVDRADEPLQHDADSIATSDVDLGASLGSDMADACQPCCAAGS